MAQFAWLWKVYPIDPPSQPVRCYGKPFRPYCLHFQFHGIAMAYRFIPLFGDFSFPTNEPIRFHGGTISYPDQKDPTIIHDNGAAHGIALADRTFLDGRIAATITFTGIGPLTQAGFIIWSDPTTGANIHVLLNRINGGGPMFLIRSWDGKKYVELGMSGDGSVMEANHPYEFEVFVDGSNALMTVDGIQVLKCTLPAGLRQSSAGIYGFSHHDIEFKDFVVEPRCPKAFVVMQFTAPYNELWKSVVEPVCKSKNIEAKRADDDYGPGMIIADVVQAIRESSVVIAEITPTNANVYYEVGYAHALGKPTILIAERGTKLPFDISGFRVLMYENSIDGKAKFEQGLIKHLDSVLKQ